jgi:hypothetical protein
MPDEQKPTVPASAQPQGTVRSQAERERDAKAQEVPEPLYVPREERQTPARKAYDRAMREQAELRVEHGLEPGPEVEVSVLKHSTDKDRRADDFDPAVDQAFYRHARNDALAAETQAQEFARAQGHYPGEIAPLAMAVDKLDMPPPGVLDVVRAAPQGMSSRHGPAERGGF